MNVLEQIYELENQITSIGETLSKLGEMQTWEAKEYLTVALGYVTELQRLRNHVAENIEVFS